MTTLELPLPALAKGRFARIEAYTDEALFDASGVRIAFTTRAGGVSEGPFAALNLGSHVNDDRAAVDANRALVREALCDAQAELIVPNQVHGDGVLAMDADSDLDCIRAAAAEGADALAVFGGDAAALLCYADCVPVILVAPSGSFAVVHAGWRGVDNRISAKTALLMARREAQENGVPESCALASLNVYLGPHIHGECFETGPDVHARFAEAFGSACVVDGSHIDLAAALRVQLAEAGIAAERVADVGRCTVCCNDEFFSYRAQGGICGRHGALAYRCR